MASSRMQERDTRSRHMLGAVCADTVVICERRAYARDWHWPNGHPARSESEDLLLRTLRYRRRLA